MSGLPHARTGMLPFLRLLELFHELVQSAVWTCPSPQLTESLVHSLHGYFLRTRYVPCAVLVLGAQPWPKERPHLDAS